MGADVWPRDLDSYGVSPNESAKQPKLFFRAHGGREAVVPQCWGLALGLHRERYVGLDRFSGQHTLDLRAGRWASVDPGGWQFRRACLCGLRRRMALRSQDRDRDPVRTLGVVARRTTPPEWESDDPGHGDGLAAGSRTPFLSVHRFDDCLRDIQLGNPVLDCSGRGRHALGGTVKWRF